MAITVGNTSSSGDAGSPNTAHSWNHTVHADSNLLIVTTRVRDTSGVDADVSGGLEFFGDAAWYAAVFGDQDVDGMFFY